MVALVIQLVLVINTVKATSPPGSATCAGAALFVMEMAAGRSGKVAASSKAWWAKSTGSAGVGARSGEKERVSGVPTARGGTWTMVGRPCASV